MRANGFTLKLGAILGLSRARTAVVPSKGRQSIRVLASLVLMGVLLTWPGQRQAGAETDDECTIFEDWNEIDSLWKLFWAGDDPYHKHESGPHPGPGWRHLRDVQATGYRHLGMLPNWTMESGEHGFCTSAP